MGVKNPHIFFKIVMHKVHNDLILIRKKFKIDNFWLSFGPKFPIQYGEYYVGSADNDVEDDSTLSLVMVLSA